MAVKRIHNLLSERGDFLLISLSLTSLRLACNSMLGLFVLRNAVQNKPGHSLSLLLLLRSLLSIARFRPTSGQPTSRFRFLEALKEVKLISALLFGRTTISK